MRYWEIKIEVWPHSSGNGATKDQEACGDRERTFKTYAENAAEAMKHADLIVTGIKTNPMVWKAPIISLRQMDHMEDITCGRSGA